MKNNPEVERFTYAHDDITPDKNGEYVLYSDYQKAMEQIAGLEQKLQIRDAQFEVAKSLMSANSKLQSKLDDLLKENKCHM